RRRQEPDGGPRPAPARDAVARRFRRPGLLDEQDGDAVAHREGEPAAEADELPVRFGELPLAPGTGEDLGGVEGLHENSFKTGAGTMPRRAAPTPSRRARKAPPCAAAAYIAQAPAPVLLGRGPGRARGPKAASTWPRPGPRGRRDRRGAPSLDRPPPRPPRRSARRGRHSRRPWPRGRRGRCRRCRGRSTP